MPTLEQIMGLIESIVERQGQLAAEIELISGRQPGADGQPAVPLLVNWKVLTPPLELAALSDLAGWVEWFAARYATTADWLRPCWWQHGFVVEELAALRTSWLVTYTTPAAATALAGPQWLEAAHKCGERVRTALASGSNCSIVNHNPDDTFDHARWNSSRDQLGSRSVPETRDGQLNVPAVQPDNRRSRATGVHEHPLELPPTRFEKPADLIHQETTEEGRNPQ